MITNWTKTLCAAWIAVAATGAIGAGQAQANSYSVKHQLCVADMLDVETIWGPTGDISTEYRNAEIDADPNVLRVIYNECYNEVYPMNTYKPNGYSSHPHFKEMTLDDAIAKQLAHKRFARAEGSDQ